MKRILIFLVFLAIGASCTSPAPALIPVDTAVYLTLAAEPKTDTPTPTASVTMTPTSAKLATTQAVSFNISAPGAECIPANNERTRGLVTRILDGATVEVVIGNDLYQIKYIGLQAPRISLPVEWKGPQSYAANERLAGGQNVILVKDTTSVDQDGFLPRYVVAGDVFVNYELVRTGFARVLLIPPDMACAETFMAAQTEAQTAILGIWVPTPVPTPTIKPTATITPTPTKTLKPACDCKKTYTCKDFDTTELAQACFDYCKLITGKPVIPDKNGNGKVCEGGAG